MTRKSTIVTREIRTKNGLEELTFGPRKAIRLKCLDCCCFSKAEVRLCTAYDCPLWSYRMSHGAEPLPDIGKSNS